MKSLTPLAIALAAALASAAGAETPAPKPLPRLRGMLTVSGDGALLTSCGKRQYGIVDETGGDLAKVHAALAQNADAPVFVELRGSVERPPDGGPGAQYERILRVSEVRRAEKEGPGCRNDLRAVAVRALGGEPTWRVDVSKLGAVFAALDAPVPLKFPYELPTTTPTARIYRFAGAGHHLELTLKHERCRDTMAGNLFPYTAVMRLDGREYRGCGYDGDAQ